jgi:Fe-S oxidoreductase
VLADGGATGLIGLEGLDAALVAGARLPPGPSPPLPTGGAWLLAELGGGDSVRVAADAHALADRLRGAARVVAVEVIAEPAAQARLWELREAALAATARTADGRPTHPGWEDSAVAPERLGGYLRDLRALLDRHRLTSTFYGHFGDGCVHSKIDFDLASEAGRTVYRRFLDEAVDLVVRHGGVASGEHGDGQARGELLARLYGAEIVEAMGELKAIWDPDGGLNPGKVVDPRPILEDLRAAEPPPSEPETTFAYADDGGRFSAAVGRCVGVGKCVKTQGGTMCPSYRATRDERHSTRGRAHLLDAMLRGGLGGGVKESEGDDRWRSRAVHAALDLCLACKACKSECPAGVDMATYKAEFLHHYHAHHRRPRAAWALGRVATWARWAAKAPRLDNALAGLPGASHLAKLAGGIAPERPLPRFAVRGLRQRLAARPAAADGGRPVLLWLDTFNQHFTPEVGVAAAEVLEAAGFEVRLPPERPLCCGRPLYDFGFLDAARQRLAEVLDALAPEIAAGVPVVGLEPSCVAVFRDELPALLPNDPRARLLGGLVVGLGELLDREGVAPGARLDGRAVFHGHCHQRALTGTDADVRVLRAVGLEVETPDTGCCGMAGAFGYERDKYEVSVKVAEQGLLPALRAAPPGAYVVADGFSCRRQIEDLGGGRRAWHLAEVLRAALV